MRNSVKWTRNVCQDYSIAPPIAAKPVREWVSIDVFSIQAAAEMDGNAAQGSRRKLAIEYC
jgi:hypothetical protein